MPIGAARQPRGLDARLRRLFLGQIAFLGLSVGLMFLRAWRLDWLGGWLVAAKFACSLAAQWLFHVALPAVLGSWWSVPVMAVSGVATLVRTSREDRYLMAHLPGYSEYAAQVRWRLLPRVW